MCIQLRVSNCIPYSQLCPFFISLLNVYRIFLSFFAPTFANFDSWTQQRREGVDILQFFLDRFKAELRIFEILNRNKLLSLLLDFLKDFLEHILI